MSSEGVTVTGAEEFLGKILVWDRVGFSDSRRGILPNIPDQTLGQLILTNWLSSECSTSSPAPMGNGKSGPKGL